MYDSPAEMQLSINASESQVVTVSLRRQAAAGGLENNDAFFEFLQSFHEHNRYLLPNTAGCHSAKEAITTSLMARELFKTNWIKIRSHWRRLHVTTGPISISRICKRIN